MSRKLGIGLALIGFILIGLNVIDYIGGFFGFSLEIRTSMIIGIVLVAVSMFIARNERS